MSDPLEGLRDNHGPCREQLADTERRLRLAREGLEAIEGYETDWTLGTGNNVNAMAEIARRTLAQLDVPAGGSQREILKDAPAPLGEPTWCPLCGGDGKCICDYCAGSGTNGEPCNGCGGTGR